MRFAEMAENKHQTSQSLLNKFHKQRDAEVVKLAEEYGYFFYPTEKALLSHCGEQNSQQKDIAEFRLIHLNGVHLRVLGDIGLCTRLSICLLANNFLTKIDALVTCRHLIRLDVHSNQLVSIPGSSFWENLAQLQVLHLHDNPLVKLETLQILSSAPCLSILTLYDTPLSLKKNYRHHVVNTIWTLKALDMHVISDEEILEDAVFTSDRFTALSPAFRVDLCPKTPLNFTFAQEMSVFHDLIAKVNSILAMHSPVHIVQRCVRGYLVRRKLGITQKLRPVKSVEMMTHPPSTPVFPCSPVWTTFAGEVVDYDSYMRNLRPGSVVVPDETSKALHQLHSKDSTMEGQSSFQEDRHFSINIQKLKSGILPSLQAETVAMEYVLPEREDLGLVSRKERRRKNHGNEKDNKPKPKRIKDIKQFFGPVVPTFLPEKEEHEIPLADFRLKGWKPQLLIVDATTEMILSKKEAGQMVRRAEAEHMRRELLQPPERDKAEAAAAKIDNILAMKEDRLRAKDMVKKHHDEQRYQLLKSKDLDKSRITEQMEKQELQRLNFLDKLQEYKVRRSDFSKMFKADYSFMQDFNCRYTSVSNALKRYDHQAYVEDSKDHRQRNISNAKKTEQEQQEVVKKLLEHRKLMRQSEIATAKAALKTKILIEAKERAKEAQTRVANHKARPAGLVAFYSIPNNTMSHPSSAQGMSMREISITVSSASGVNKHHIRYTESV